MKTGNVYNNRTVIVLSVILSFLCIVIIPVNSDSEFQPEEDEGFDFVDYFDNQFIENDEDDFRDLVSALKGVMCYKCDNNNENGMECKVNNGDFDQFIEENESYIDGMKDEENGINLIDEFYNNFLTLNNPCKIMTNKILQLVASTDNTLVPIHIDFYGKDAKTKYEELKDAISTIQFQKRQSTHLMTVEVQFRHRQDEPVSFILPDFDQQFLTIPQTSIFYTSL